MAGRVAERLRAGLVPGQRVGVEEQIALPGLVPALADPDAAARDEWHRMVPLLSERNEVRLSSGSGRGRYLARDTAPLIVFPDRPACINVYLPNGIGRLLVGDFDAHPGSGVDPRHVRIDAAGMVELVESCGGRCIVDASPHGGVHVIVVFASFLPAFELARLAKALKLRFANRAAGWHDTFDTGPMTSGANESLLRPPGSPHRLGGFQRLVTPVAEAETIARTGNDGGVYQRLLAALERELLEVDPPPFHAAAPAPSQAAEELAEQDPAAALQTRPKRMSARMRAIAEDGTWDPARYDGPSEARFAVFVHLAARGWTADDIRAELAAGRFAGLHRLLRVHRSGEVDRRALRSDAEYQALMAGELERATTWLQDQKEKARAAPDRIGKSWPLAGPHTTAGGEGAPTAPSRAGGGGPVIQLPPGRERASVHQWLRSWQTATRELCLTRYRCDPTVRLVLAALAGLAAYRQTTTLGVGRRALSLASGISDSAVSAALHKLEDLGADEKTRDQAPIVLIEKGVKQLGTPDVYELVIPEALKDLACWRTWRPGPIAPVHPVLQYLGISAAIVYAELGTTPIPRPTLEYLAGLSDRGLRNTLTTLAEHGLAERSGPGWVRSPGTLESKIVTRPSMINFMARVEEYRLERTEFRKAMGLFDFTGMLTVQDILDAAPDSSNVEPAAPSAPAEPAPAAAQPSSDAAAPTSTAAAVQDSAEPGWMAELPFPPEPAEPPGGRDEWQGPDEAAIDRLAALAERIGPIYAITPDDDWKALGSGARPPTPPPVPWSEAAAILGLSLTVTKALSPTGRRFPRAVFDALVASEPAWMGDEEAAAAEARRRAAAAAERRNREMHKINAWALMLEVPAWSLRGLRLPAPMPGNIETAQARIAERERVRAVRAADPRPRWHRR